MRILCDLPGVVIESDREQRGQKRKMKLKPSTWNDDDNIG